MLSGAGYGSAGRGTAGMGTEDQVATVGNIREYLDVLRRYRSLLGVLVLAALAATVLLTAVQARTYRAEATVVVRTQINQQLFPLGTGAGIRLTRNLVSELDFTTTDEYLSVATGLVDPDITMSVGVDADSSILRFTAEGSDRDAVAAAANSWAEAYRQVRDDLDTRGLITSQTTLQNSIDELQVRREAVLAPVRTIDDLIAGETDSETVAQLTTQRISALQLIQSELSPIDSELAVFNNQIATVDVDLELRKQPGISAQAGRTARPPSSPISPSWPRNLALGASVGLVAAVAIVLLLDSTRVRLLDHDDLSLVLGAPVLGEIPQSKLADLTPAAVLNEDAPLLTEAFQRVVTGLLFQLDTNQQRSIMITSPVSTEGKTTVTAITAAMLARQGRKVLVMGGDLRRPTIHEIFGGPLDPGLADVLEDRTSVYDAVFYPPDIPYIGVLSAGIPSKNPADLLRSGAFASLVDKLLTEADLLLIDAPPTLPVADAVEIGRVVDAVVIVGRANSSKRTELANTAALIRSGGGTIVGGVLNAAKGISHRYDSYERRG